MTGSMIIFTPIIRKMIFELWLLEQIILGFIFNMKFYQYTRNISQESSIIILKIDELLNICHCLQERIMLLSLFLC